jgi:hypothetical protein
VTTTDNTDGEARLLHPGHRRIVLLVMFKSVSIPIILIMAIEVSIWINEAVPYFTGETINFVAFLVIDAVQLGAAVDYAIIYTEEYLKRRKQMPKREASFHGDRADRAADHHLELDPDPGVPRHLPQRLQPDDPAGGHAHRPWRAHLRDPDLLRAAAAVQDLLDGFVRHTSYKIGFYMGDGSQAATATATESATDSAADAPSDTNDPDGTER